MTLAKRDPQLIDRDHQILNRLARIEHKIDSLDQTTAFALRAEAAKHQESVLTVFGKRVRRAQVYLASDGTRTVQEIARFLRMHAPHVSRELVVLKEEGLLELIDSSSRGDVYAKKAVDRTLRISKTLCDNYSLRFDGQVQAQSNRPVGKSAKPRTSRRK